MEQRVFERLKNIIYHESGIVLPPEKLPLLSNRIQKRLNALGIKDEARYLEIVESDLSGTELINLIDAISTNVTHFYREPQHFAKLREILCSGLNALKQEVRIWCAAAASGEEPYTIAFEALEVQNLERHGLKILASDICTKVLNKAVQGQYSQTSIEKIPTTIRNKYMECHTENGQTLWRVNSDIRKFVLFKKLNLVNFPYPLKGPFDIIFCRNVMIYFDLKTREKIVREFWRLLGHGGFLFLSLSENLLGIENDFEALGQSVFRKT